jgi:hypothetical protein
VKQRFLDRILGYWLRLLGDDDRRLLAPLPPPPGGRARLLAALDSAERFRVFLGPLCDVVDLPEDVMRRHLALVDDGGAWVMGPVPGLYLTHFQPGPRLSSVDVDAGFVRVSAGQTIPRHRHLGPEVALVLEGTLWEDGVAYLPGRLVKRGTGSVHGFKAGRERDLLLAVTHCGVEIV